MCIPEKTAVIIASTPVLIQAKVLIFLDNITKELHMVSTILIHRMTPFSVCHTFASDVRT